LNYWYCSVTFIFHSIDREVIMRTLFFEVMNTLIRNVGFEEEVAKLLKAELNLRISIEELSSKIKHEWSGKYNTLVSKGIYRSIRQLAKEVVLSIVKHHMVSLSPQEIDYFGNAVSSIIVETAELYNDVIDTIEKLNQIEAPMYILTNLDNDIVKKILLKYGILRYFKGVISSDLTRAGKPSVKIFQAALNRAKVSKDKGLIISGLVEDIIGAKLFGLKIIFINRLGLKPTVQPDYEVDSLTKIPEIISKV